jgi:hypothetical protein
MAGRLTNSANWFAVRRSSAYPLNFYGSLCRITRLSARCRASPLRELWRCRSFVDGHPVLLPIDTDTARANGLSSLLDDLGVTGDHRAPGDGANISVSHGLPPRGIAANTLPAVELDMFQHVAAALDDAHRYLDGSVVNYFAQQLDKCKVDDGNLGPAKALPMVLGILGAIQHHAREVKPNVRRALLQVGADGAEFAGWLYRDLHDPTSATYWHDRAIEWAQEAGDLAMQGYVLLKKSQMAYEGRDALRVLTLAQAAQNGPWRLPPKVRAEVAQQEARGLAMLGERSAPSSRSLTRPAAFLVPPTLPTNPGSARSTTRAPRSCARQAATSRQDIRPERPASSATCSPVGCCPVATKAISGHAGRLHLL